LGHSEGALLAGGELVSTLSSELPPDHQIFYLDLSTTRKPRLVAFECLVVPCIFDSRLASSLIDEVDIFTPELVQRGFVVCLDTYGAHGDFWGRTASAPYTMKKRVSPMARLGDVRFPHSVQGSSSIHLLPCFFKPS
jgi:hypothetical protein